MTAQPVMVLVVEDEALLLFSIAEDLRAEGFEALEASNADEAVRLIEANPRIEFLFTDIDMPGSMDGLKLAAAVRNRWPPIKIIVTSGKAKPRDEDLPDGIFVSKPYVAHGVVAAFKSSSTSRSSELSSRTKAGTLTVPAL